MTSPLQQREKICIHHVGGRAGSRAFPVMGRFEGDLISVLYEADADCIAQIKERNQQLASRLEVLPFCLAEASKSAELNINFDPYTSSVYEVNPAYEEYYFFYRNYDYLLGQAMRVMERRQVRTVMLDEIVASGQVTPPDFLSIDTQGSEFDILQGAVETLRSDVLAVLLEAEFFPVYKNQKLFGDICEWMSSQGFHFARFLDLQQISPYRAAVGLRGEGFHFACDALFLKRLDSVCPDGDPPLRALQLRKLAFMSMIFQQFEYGWALLTRAEEQADTGNADWPTSPAGGPDLDSQYLKFLTELQQAVRKMPKKYLHSISEYYQSFAESKARFEVADSPPSALRSLKLRLLKAVPAFFVIWRNWKAGIKQISKYIRNLNAGISPVEKIFRQYGLTAQAMLLRSKRLMHEQYLR